MTRFTNNVRGQITQMPLQSLIESVLLLPFGLTISSVRIIGLFWFAATVILLYFVSKSLSKKLGILEKENKIAYRATYIIDPDGVIQHVSVNGLNVGRNIAETIRLLDAFQNGGLVPCDWQPGQATIQVN